MIDMIYALTVHWMWSPADNRSPEVLSKVNCNKSDNSKRCVALARVMYVCARLLELNTYHAANRQSEELIADRVQTQ